MTNAARTRLRELAEKHQRDSMDSPLPWRTNLDDGTVWAADGDCIVSVLGNGVPYFDFDTAEFVALACNSMLPLLDEVERLEKALRLLVEAADAVGDWLLEDIEKHDSGFIGLSDDVKILRNRKHLAEAALRGEEPAK